LTSLATTLSSMASSLAHAVTPPPASPTNSDHTEVWARPRTPRFGGLKMPPRMAGDGAKQVLYTLPPHQQRYAASVAAAAASGRSSPSIAPPPPPPGAPPRSQPLSFVPNG
jgi:hypothetical protein